MIEIARITAAAWASTNRALVRPWIGCVLVLVICNLCSSKMFVYSARAMPPSSTGSPSTGRRRRHRLSSGLSHAQPIYRSCMCQLFFNLAASATQINEKRSSVLTEPKGLQKFPADPKANRSGHSCSFQLAKTLPRTNPHW